MATMHTFRLRPDLVAAPHRIALVLGAALLLAAAPAVVPPSPTSAAPAAAKADALPPAPQPVAEEERTVVADSQVLVYRAGADGGTRTLEDLGRDEARVIWDINETRGTYQSYLLYAQDDLPMPLLAPGFTITLPPPRKRVAENATTSTPPAPPPAMPVRSSAPSP